MKEYKIFLDGKFIGITNLEFADVPMGMVYGKIIFSELENPYLFFKEYCINNEIEYSFIEDEKYINTFTLKNMKIIYNENSELMGNCSISGFGNDFQIDVYDITETIMKNLFLSHYYDYYDTTD